MLTKKEKENLEKLEKYRFGNINRYIPKRMGEPWFWRIYRSSNNYIFTKWKKRVYSNYLKSYVLSDEWDKCIDKTISPP
jgi:hypothetical protein